MGDLFARIDKAKAERLMESWPPHRWYERSVLWLLQQPTNQKNVKKVPLNEPLLESIRENGFQSPFLTTDSWYPITGSQRLRAAMELPDEVLAQTKIRICKFDKPYWQPFFNWYNQEKGQECVQIYFQMCEVVFKTVYMPETDNSGVPMLDFEEGGNKLHWPLRDDKKVQNKS